MGSHWSHVAPAHHHRAVGLADPTHHFDEEFRPRHAADTTCSHLTLARSIEVPAELVVDPSPRLKVLKVSDPPPRKAGIKVPDVATLVDKLKNEAKVI